MAYGSHGQTTYTGQSGAAGYGGGGGGGGFVQNPDLIAGAYGADYLALTSDEQMRVHVEVKNQLAFDYWQAKEAEKGATERARIAAGASAAASAAGLEGDRISADAQIQSANIAAESARYRADTDYRIAQMNDATLRIEIGVSLRNTIATTTAKPIDWTKQIAQLGGVPAAQAPTTGVTEYLNAPVPGLEMPTGPLEGVPAAALSMRGAAPQVTAAAGQQVAPPVASTTGQQAWQAFQRMQGVGAQAAPSAVVGENTNAPELVTAPGGATITPLNPEEARWALIRGAKPAATGAVLQSSWRQGYNKSQAAGGYGRTPAPVEVLHKPWGGLSTTAGMGAGVAGVSSTPTTADYLAAFANPIPSPTPATSTPSPAPVTSTPDWRTPAVAAPTTPAVPAPVEPTTGQPMGMTEWNQKLFGAWPAFQATTLSRKLPGSEYEMRWPWESNLGDFLRQPTQVQDAQLAAWRQAGVIAGETAEEMWNSAMTMMKQASFQGAASPVSAYG